MPQLVHLALALWMWVALAAPPQLPSRARVIQSVDLLVPFAPVMFAQAGSRQLVYELHVTNFHQTDVSLTAVRVSTTDGRLLAEHKDSDLQRHIVRPGLRNDHATPHIVAPGMRAVVNFWITLAAGSAAPSSVTHAVELDLVAATGSTHTVVEGGVSAVTSQAVAILDPPLRGGPWVAIYDPLLRGGHRTAIYTVDGRARIPGRFAIDFITLPQGGSIVRDPAVRPDNWNGFGSDVLAVADGTVAAAADDTPDDTPRPVAPENAGGNYVALDIGSGRLAFYEHLQRGTVLVKVGQRIRRGQPLAKLGSSGSTSIGPHLHFHVADRNSLLGAEGLPFVFKEFADLGGFASIDALIGGQKWLAAEQARPRALERPSPNAVLRFPDR
jgi:Peptidase family M23